MFSVKILADSRNPNGDRLTTVELTYPRFIHSEFMTHRMFSRNAASSRAIPINKMLENIKKNPVIPIQWGSNKPGMQSGEEVTPLRRKLSKFLWLRLRDIAVWAAKLLNLIGLHKQIVNRIVEPWMWITIIATGNEAAFENLFSLRCHPDAEPHFQHLAYLLRHTYDNNYSVQLNWGEWHLPLIRGEDDSLATDEKVKVSVGRCARVSYLTHDGVRDPSKDVELHDRLLKSGHWSPFEHAAKADENGKSGNFERGWYQYRKYFANEVVRKRNV